MREVDPATAAALDSPERVITGKVLIDWNNDGAFTNDIDDVTQYTSSIEVDRSLTGSLPDEVSMSEGYSAAQASVDLVSGATDDERKDAAWTFSPYNEASPYAASNTQRVAVPAKVSIEVQREDGTFEDIPRLVGTVRDLNVSVKDRTADMAILDSRDKLAGAVSLPVIDGDLQGCNASSLISYGLQTAGMGVAPPIRDNCKLYWPMHGSIQPMIAGENATQIARMIDDNFTPVTFTGIDPNLRPDFVDGKHFKAVNASWTSSRKKSVGGVVFPATGGLDIYSQNNASGTFSIWLYGSSVPLSSGPGTYYAPGARFALSCYNNTINDKAYMEWGVYNNGHPYMFASSPSFGPIEFANLDTIDGDRWRHVTWWWDFTGASAGSTPVAGICVDNLSIYYTTWDQIGQPQARILTGLPLEDDWSPLIAEVVINVPVCDIQMNALPKGNSMGPSMSEVIYEAPVSGAPNLAYSRLELGGNVETDPQEIWGLISDIAEAEQASVYFDEDGVFQYRTLDVRGSDEGMTVQQTVTSVDHITEFDIAQSVDSIKNEVSVSYAGYQASRFTVVYSTTDTFTIPAHSKTVIRLTMENPVSWLFPLEYAGPPAPWLWDNAWTWPGESSGDLLAGMGCARKSAQPSTDPNNIVGMPLPVVVKTGALYIDVRIDNPYGYPVYIYNDGQVVIFGGGVDNDKNLAAMKSFGSPSIMLVGNSLKRQEKSAITVPDFESIAKYGRQALTFDNDYIQSDVVANSLARSIIADTKEPVPVATLKTLGDPRRQLGDRVKAQDPEGNLFDQDFWTQGITESLSDGYTQSLEVRGANERMFWSGGGTTNNTWDDFAWAPGSRADD